MSKQTIYEKYGGFDFFHKIIYDLYLELFDHLEISYHFFGVDLERLSNLQAQYLCQAIGGPPYKGTEVSLVHKHMRITEYEFNTVTERFAEIFKKHGLDSDEVDFIMKYVKSKKPLIVTTKQTLIDRVMRFFYKKWKILKRWWKNYCMAKK